MPGSFEKMMQLVTAFFDTKSDPDQLQVTEADRKCLLQLHEATMSEYADEGGPIVWVLIIPTLHELMERFVKSEISEQQLLNETPVGVRYDAIYLCSITVLPEYRGKGLAKKVTLVAIKSICKDHPIKSLFLWPFSKEGEGLAESIAGDLNMPLLKRDEH